MKSSRRDRDIKPLGEVFMMNSIQCRPDLSRIPRAVIGWAGGVADYNAKAKVMVKVLDFVRFGGSKCTVLRTFRWDVQL